MKQTHGIIGLIIIGVLGFIFATQIFSTDPKQFMAALIAGTTIPFILELILGPEEDEQPKVVR